MFPIGFICFSKILETNQLENNTIKKMRKRIVRSTLNENPNSIIKPSVWEKRKDNPSYTPDAIEFDEDGNIPFGFYGPSKTLITGDNYETHVDLLANAIDMEVVKEGTPDAEIERTYNSGRLFTLTKVITFWRFPKTYEELEGVIKELERDTGLNILSDKDWMIEIPSGVYTGDVDNRNSAWGTWHPRIGDQYFIPINDYKGGYKRTTKDMGQGHNYSPLDKRKKKRPPMTISDDKLRGLDKLKWDQAKFSENFIKGTK